MVDKTSGGLPPEDRTPASVLKKMAENEAAYPKDDCLECGAVIRIGFFFDGFGRSRDVDRNHPTFYSNICRLRSRYIDDGNDTRQPTFTETPKNAAKATSLISER